MVRNRPTNWPINRLFLYLNMSPFFPRSVPFSWKRSFTSKFLREITLNVLMLRTVIGVQGLLNFRSRFLAHEKHFLFHNWGTSINSVSLLSRQSYDITVILSRLKHLVSHKTPRFTISELLSLRAFYGPCHQVLFSL